MSLKVYIALAVSVISLGVAIISWSWPMLINAVVAYWLAELTTCCGLICGKIARFRFDDAERMSCVAG